MGIKEWAGKNIGFCYSVWKVLEEIFESPLEQQACVCNNQLMKQLMK